MLLDLGNTNGGRQINARIGYVYAGAFYRLADSLCQFTASGKLGILQCDDELITTVAKHDVGITSVLLQDAGIVPQHFISDSVSAIVVYCFKAVDITYQ